jgi:hypothetical protein
MILNNTFDSEQMLLRDKNPTKTSCGQAADVHGFCGVSMNSKNQFNWRLK